MYGGGLFTQKSVLGIKDLKMKTPKHCLQCKIISRPNGGGETTVPVCNPPLCLKTLQSGRARFHARAKSPARAAQPLGVPPQETLEIELDEDAGTDESRKIAPASQANYRPVSNRAGKTVMARPGLRTCDPRCRNARGRVCVCSCNGRNHGAG